MRKLSSFLRSVVGHWKTFFTGFAMAVSGHAWQAATWIWPTLQVPVFQPWMLWAPGLILTGVTMFHAWREESDRADKTQSELDGVRAARPRLVCRGQKFVSLFSNSVYRFHALQIWICNDPEKAFGGATAKDVSVQVAVFRPATMTPFCSLVTQWVDAFDPEAASYVATRKTVDIPPNDIPAKFFLLLHHLDADDDCFIHTFSAQLGQPDGRVQKYRLPPGEYRIVLSFRGANCADEIDLRLRVHGRGRVPEVLNVAKKHDEPLLDGSHAAEPDTCPSCGQLVEHLGAHLGPA